VRITLGATVVEEKDLGGALGRKVSTVLIPEPHHMPDRCDYNTTPRNSDCCQWNHQQQN
jgi:hypothetical protein